MPIDALLRFTIVGCGALEYNEIVYFKILDVITGACHRLHILITWSGNPTLTRYSHMRHWHKLVRVQLATISRLDNFLCCRGLRLIILLMIRSR